MQLRHLDLGGRNPIQLTAGDQGVLTSLRPLATLCLRKAGNVARGVWGDRVAELKQMLSSQGRAVTIVTREDSRVEEFNGDYLDCCV